MLKHIGRYIGLPLKRNVVMTSSGSLLLSATLLQVLKPRGSILNDTIIGVNQKMGLPNEIGLPTRSYPSRSNRRAIYSQLCYGSIVGVICGVIVGKISSLLVFITGIGFLCLQFLQNRGMISSDSTRSLSHYAVKIGREKIDLNTLLWDRPSFKISFILTFGLAALNV